MALHSRGILAQMVQHNVQQTHEQSRPPNRSSCWTASAASPRTCTLSTGDAALRWQPAAPPRRHAGQLCVCEPRRRGCSGSHRRGHSGPRRRGGAELSGGGGDTIKESSSSADDADAVRKRARCYKESSPCSLIHIRSDTSLHLHITTFGMHDFCSHDTLPNYLMSSSTPPPGEAHPGHIPGPVVSWIASAPLAALRKKDGNHHPVVVEETLQRLTAKAQHMRRFLRLAPMPQQRGRTVPLDHGLGQRVQPDLQVLLPARIPSNAARTGQAQRFVLLE